MPMTIAVSALVVFLIAYTAAGALLARNAWNLADRASAIDLLGRRPSTWRAGGFMMAASGPALLAFVIAEILRSR